MLPQTQTGRDSKSQAWRVVAHVPAAARDQVRDLLFFNARQHRHRNGIHAAVERYGDPVLKVHDGLLHAVTELHPEAQSLFLVDGSIVGGVVVYQRLQPEWITGLHIAVADLPNETDRLAAGARLCLELNHIARRLRGVRGVRLQFYRTTRGAA